MCGRYSQIHDAEALKEIFGVMRFEEQVTLPPRYNIAPTQLAPVIVELDGARVLKLMKWGLVPSWAKDLAIGNKLINARGETLDEKPSFRAAFKKRRCIVLADGFFEWKKVPGEKNKVPVRICRKDLAPMAFAGIWEAWRENSEDPWLLSFTIVTTEPNELIATFHHRMPVILDKEGIDLWLDAAVQDVELLKPLIKPYSSDAMMTYDVSRTVNSPANDVEECILPLKIEE